ncbi:hypothetical protein LNA01_26850 [Companilactobacillus nantensis]|nr:hypothetical protein LNA01_26850 [Companilactobacillus nantensis]
MAVDLKYCVRNIRYIWTGFQFSESSNTDFTKNYLKSSNINQNKKYLASDSAGLCQQ